MTLAHQTTPQESIAQMAVQPINQKFSAKPSQVKVDVAQQMLHLHWPDGKIQALSHQSLREQCPCGFCRARRLRQQVIKAVDSVVITAMFDQGYGAQICFSDGHEQGIFPWAYVYALTGTAETETETTMQDQIG